MVHAQISYTPSAEKEKSFTRFRRFLLQFENSRGATGFSKYSRTGIIILFGICQLRRAWARQVRHDGLREDFLEA
jgi:hypothetical protein